MNLSPIWVRFLTDEGFDAVHWSQIGDPRAEDPTIMQWARSNDHVVFTHDLGFSALLAAGGQDSPSVIQVRSQDVMPEAIGADVVGVLRVQRRATGGDQLYGLRLQMLEHHPQLSI